MHKILRKSQRDTVLDSMFPMPAILGNKIICTPIQKSKLFPYTLLWLWENSRMGSWPHYVLIVLMKINVSV